MKSKYFGEFLVEKGVITQDNLVEALIEQISSTPPLCQVIFQKKILPPAKIFEAFRFQQDHQVEFMNACKEIGVWTKEIQDKVSMALDDVRKPLGHILVSRGLLDLKKLTTMLDEFLSQVQTAAAPSLEEVKPTTLAPAPTPAPVAAQPQEAVDESLTEVYQPGILMELEETFDEKKRKMVRVALSLVKDNAGGDKEICKKLMQDVYKIVGSLNGLLGLLALDKLSELLSAAEKYLSQLQSKIPDRSKDDLIKDTELLTSMIDLAWTLRLSIMANSTESVFFADTGQKQKFNQLVSDLKG